MDLRELEEGFFVAPQILPEEMATLVEKGFTTVICNRPDPEVPPNLQMSAMRAAAEAAGLVFLENPLTPGMPLEDAAARQGSARAEATGPTLAYCASGTRSAALWALSRAGDMSTDDILTATARAGYALDGLTPQLEALARR
jgi:uncharacterized protein (TIGR01244 family)